jgi:hypothetical protein
MRQCHPLKTVLQAFAEDGATPAVKAPKKLLSGGPDIYAFRNHQERRLT